LLFFLIKILSDNKKQNRENPPLCIFMPISCFYRP